MDSELFELCKEVYKRTGWQQYPWLKNYPIENVEGISPFYTSDYLLEKMPRYIEQLEPGEAPSSNESADDKVLHFLTIDVSSNDWFASYCYEGWCSYLERADTPLKALLKLTIALHEAGELTNLVRPKGESDE